MADSRAFANHRENDSRWQTGVFAMGQAIAVRTDYAGTEVRLLAKRAKDAAQARRLLAIAAVLDGSSRTEAATNAGMDRQTLRDWVSRFNEQGRMVWSTPLRQELLPSSMTRTRPFSPGSSMRARSRRSMVWCAGARATSSCGCMRSSGSRYRTTRSTAP